MNCFDRQELSGLDIISSCPVNIYDVDVAGYLLFDDMSGLTYAELSATLAFTRWRLFVRFASGRWLSDSESLRSRRYNNLWLLSIMTLFYRKPQMFLKYFLLPVTSPEPTRSSSVISRHSYHGHSFVLCLLVDLLMFVTFHYTVWYVDQDVGVSNNRWMLTLRLSVA